jgi:alkaline phosphatase D
MYRIDRPQFGTSEGAPTGQTTGEGAATPPPGDARAEALGRRAFLDVFLKGAGCYAVLASVPFAPGALAAAEHHGVLDPHGAVAFPQGVASGDPSPTSVVLWTRAVQTDGSASAVDVTLQVSTSPDFSEVVVEERLSADGTTDHTVRIIVDGLAPDTRYWYRFGAGGSWSDPVGRTRTAPEADADRPVRLAFASCQAYEAGYYGAWRTLINRDEAAPEEEQLDLVLHLGDFIYEALGYGGARSVPPFPSGGASTGAEFAGTHAVTLDDYRHLWKVYLADPDLRAARARWPFVMTWDDHEFTDDSWQGFSTYKGTPVPAQARKIAANQAWFEFVPVHLSGRVEPDEAPARDFEAAEVRDAPRAGVDDAGIDTDPNNRRALRSLTIYRSLRWGRNLDLVVTDLRSYRSEHPIPAELSEAIGGVARYVQPLPLVEACDAGREFMGGTPPAELNLGGQTIPNPRVDAPAGTMMGPEQKAWFKRRMAGSDARWKIWANSVPLMPMRLDLDRIDPAATTVVFTIDTWDGYLRERTELLDFLAESGVEGVISLSGDNHNSFAGRLLRDFGSRGSRTVGCEYSVCGISSPSLWSAMVGFVAEDDPLRPLVVHEGKAALNLTFLDGAAASVTLAQTGDLEAARAAANPDQNPHLAYCDSEANGFGVVHLSGDVAEVELVTVETPLTDTGPSGARVLRTARFTQRRSDPGALSGPEIEGAPPFPLG